MYTIRFVYVYTNTNRTYMVIRFVYVCMHISHTKLNHQPTHTKLPPIPPTKARNFVFVNGHNKKYTAYYLWMAFTHWYKQLKIKTGEPADVHAEWPRMHTSSDLLFVDRWYIYIHVYIHTHMCTHMYARYMYIHTHADMCIYTHTLLRPFVRDFIGFRAACRI